LRGLLALSFTPGFSPVIDENASTENRFQRFPCFCGGNR
jgi:hypothetical protein